MQSLPQELQSATIAYLKPHDMLNVAGISKDWRQLALRLLWRTVDEDNTCVKRILECIINDVHNNAEAAQASGFGHLSTLLISQVVSSDLLCAPCASH